MKLYRFFSYIVIGALLTTTVHPITTNQASWKERLGSNLTNLVAPALSALQTKTRSAISALTSQLHNSNPSTILNLLQKNLNQLGTNIDRIASCMLGSSTCSTRERSLFISSTIIVLALTAILIGYTVTTAATAQEIDKEVIDLSREVEGWQPNAIFERLKITVSHFTTELNGMKRCLIERKCTKKQKRILYATAATIAALATISVGIGVGSYIYTKKAAEKQRALLAQVEAKRNQPIPENVKPAFELPNFDALGTAIGQNISKWQTFIQQSLPISNTEHLLKAYKAVQADITKGFITAKVQIVSEFKNALEKIQTFPALLQETLNINLGSINNLFAKFKTDAEQLAQLMRPTKTPLGAFAKQVESTIQYFNDLSRDARLAQEEWNELSKQNNGLLTIFKAKRTSAQEFLQKRIELGEEQDRLTKQIDNALRNDKDISTLKTNLNRLNEKLGKLGKMEHFDRFASIDNLKKTYHEIVTIVNGLKLDIVGTFAEKFLHLIGNLIDVSKSMHSTAGKIGAIITNPEIDTALEGLSAGIKDIGTNLKRAVSVHPLIVTKELDISDFSIALSKALLVLGTDLFTYLSNNLFALQNMAKELMELSKKVDPIQKNLESFMAKLHSIGSTTRDRFFGELDADPVNRIAHAPALLRNALGQSIKEVKGEFNNLLTKVNDLLTDVAQVAPEGSRLLEEFSTQIGSMIGQKGDYFINRDLFGHLRPIFDHDFPAISRSLAQLLGAITKTSLAFEG